MLFAILIVLSPAIAAALIYVINFVFSNTCCVVSKLNDESETYYVIRYVIPVCTVKVAYHERISDRGTWMAGAFYAYYYTRNKSEAINYADRYIVYAADRRRNRIRSVFIKKEHKVRAKDVLAKRNIEKAHA
jgi:hypothetical protein